MQHRHLMGTTLASTAGLASRRGPAAYQRQIILVLVLHWVQRREAGAELGEQMTGATGPVQHRRQVALAAWPPDNAPTHCRPWESSPDDTTPHQIPALRPASLWCLAGRRPSRCSLGCTKMRRKCDVQTQLFPRIRARTLPHFRVGITATAATATLLLCCQGLQRPYSSAGHNHATIWRGGFNHGFGVRQSGGWSAWRTHRLPLQPGGD